MILQSQQDDPWANVVAFDNQRHEKKHPAAESPPDPYANVVDFSTQVPAQGQEIDRTPVQYMAQGGPGKAEISTTTKTVENPWTKEHGVALGHLIANGASEEQLNGFIRGTGGDPKMFDFSVALAEREKPQYHEWRRRFPDAPYPVSALQEQQLTPQEQNQAAEAATPAAAAVTAAGDAATFGGLRAATGDEGALKMDMMAAAHPGESIAGAVAGGALAAGGLEAGGVMLGAKVPGIAGRGIASPIAANALYGGLSAAQTGDPLQVLAGIGMGAAGGAVGRGVGTPSAGQSPALDRLGTLTTVGQRVGGLANEAEQQFEKLPISGALVRGARNRTRTQFQRGIFNDALSEIDGIGGARGSLPNRMAPGPEPHVFAKEQFGLAYDEARAGMRFASDPAFNTASAKLITDLKDGGLDEPTMTRFNNLVRNRVTRRLDANGDMSGDNYKEAVSDLRRQAAAIRKNPKGDGELADAIDEYTGLLDQAARRASPPEAVAKLDAADRGYAKLVRIRQAANSAGDNGRLSPSDYAKAVQVTASGQKSKSNAYLEGRALGQDNATAGLSLGKTPTTRSPLEELAVLGGGGALAHMPAAGLLPLVASAPYLFAARSSPLLQAGGRAVAAFGAPVGVMGAREAMKGLRKKRDSNK